MHVACALPVRTHLRKYVYVHVECLHVCVSSFARVCVCVCVLVYMCVYARMCVCVCVCVSVNEPSLR